MPNKPRGKPFGKGNPGKPKGAKNKLTKSFKEMLAEALNAMNEDQSQPYALLSWGKKNPNLFYPIASKLIPTELTGQLTQKIIKVVRE